jgi:hypothetical protein
LTGNPVYPLVFGGATRTVERMEQWNRAHRVPPDDRGRRYSLPQAAEALADIGWRSFWQSPLLVPLAVMSMWSPPSRRLAGMLAIYAGFFLLAWWLTTHRVDRFWVPVLPVLALLAGLGAVWSASPPWQRVLGAVLIAGLAGNLCLVIATNRHDHRYLVALEELRRDEPDEPDGPSRVHRAHRYLNDAVGPGRRVLLVGDAQPFDLEVPVLYNTCFDECIFERLMKGRSRQQRRAALRDLGISHVFVQWSEIRRYRSPGNYGFTDYVTKERIRDELVRRQGLLRPVALTPDPDAWELFEVVDGAPREGKRD